MVRWPRNLPAARATRRLLVLLLAILLAGAGYATYRVLSRATATFAWRRFDIAGSNSCLPAAEAPAAHARGLMGVRDPIPMVFVFSPARRVAFWMKDTPAPLTGVWVSGAGRVAGYWHGTPESLTAYPSPVPVRYVIEYPRGYAVPAIGSRVAISARACPPGRRL